MMQPGVYTYSIGHEAPLGLLIVTYLFLTSVSEGLIILSAYGWWRNTPAWHRLIVPAVSIGWLTAAIAPLNLLLDLAQPLNFLNLYTNFNPASPLSWGAWILLGYESSIAIFAWSVVKLLAENRCKNVAILKSALAVDAISIEKYEQKIRFLARMASVASVVFAAALMLYTAALVGVPFSRSLSANMLLPMLYLASAVAVGAAVFLWLVRDEGGTAPTAGLRKLLLTSLLAEAAVLGLILANSLAPETYGYTSLSRMFAEHKSMFAFEVLVGIVAPILILLRMKRPNYGVVAAAILLGSFATRFNLVAGLQYTTVTGQEFVRFAYVWSELFIAGGLLLLCGLMALIAVKYLNGEKLIEKTSQINRPLREM